MGRPLGVIGWSLDRTGEAAMTLPSCVALDWQRPTTVWPLQAPRLHRVDEFPAAYSWMA
jgi:hypothetical protein